MKHREKLMFLNVENSHLERCLQEANQALKLADSHLQQEIGKIKLNLEREYNRRLEHDRRQHQYELSQLRERLTSETEKQRLVTSPSQLSDSSIQDTEEIKDMRRIEMDRLYRKAN